MKLPSLSPSDALDKCLSLVGHRGPDSAARITADNRGDFKKWLVANGVPSQTASGMVLDTLREIWADTSDECLRMFQGKPAEAIFAAPSEATSAPSDDKAAAAAKAIRDLIGAAHLDETRVVELIKQHSTVTVRHELALPSGKVTTLSDQAYHPVFAEVLAAIAAGQNVLLVGPAGSGKTHLCEQVAKALALDFSFTGAVMQEHKLLGFRNPMGETIRTSFRDRYENGGVFLFDEMDASSAAALLAFNAGLANGQQDFPDGCIMRHPDFRVIASANTFGTGADRQYVGRNQLDAASLDRFYVIPMDYDAATERAIYMGEKASPVSLYSPRPLSEAQRADWIAYVHKAREGVAKAMVRHVVSGRAIASGLKALSAGIPRASVERAVLWKNLDAATITKIKAAV